MRGGGKLEPKPTLACLKRPRGQVVREVSRHQVGTGLMGTYLASWVPGPPGKRTFQNCIIQTVPGTAGKKKTRYPLG